MPGRTRVMTISALFAVGGLAAACGSSTTSPTTSPSTTASGGSTTTTGGSSGAAQVKTAKSTSLGTILVDATGFTLYHNTQDTATKSTCTGSCAAIWPPLLLPSGVSAPSGVAGLGTLHTSAGTQITYHGMPLYTYSADSSAGQTSGNGISGIWFAAKLGSSGSSGGATTTTAAKGGY